MFDQVGLPGGRIGRHRGRVDEVGRFLDREATFGAADRHFPAVVDFEKGSFEDVQLPFGAGDREFALDSQRAFLSYPKTWEFRFDGFDAAFGFDPDHGFANRFQRAAFAPEFFGDEQLAGDFQMTAVEMKGSDVRRFGRLDLQGA